MRWRSGLRSYYHSSQWALGQDRNGSSSTEDPSCVCKTKFKLFYSWHTSTFQALWWSSRIKQRGKKTGWQVPQQHGLQEEKHCTGKDSRHHIESRLGCSSLEVTVSLAEQKMHCSWMRSEASSPLLFALTGQKDSYSFIDCNFPKSIQWWTGWNSAASSAHDFSLMRHAVQGTAAITLGCYTALWAALGLTFTLFQNT